MGRRPRALAGCRNSLRRTAPPPHISGVSSLPLATVGRASFFTHAVNKGMASGDMFLADDELAQRIALGDPRFVDLLVTEVEHVDRVVPVPDRPGEA
jgi:hypothetical protein